MRKEIKEGDEVWVKFKMRVTAVAGKGQRLVETKQLFGFTANGDCVSAPLEAVVDHEV